MTARTESRLIHTKQHKQAQDEWGNKCIMLYNTIQRELEFGIAGHVAYAGCAAGSNGSRGIWD